MVAELERTCAYPECQRPFHTRNSRRTYCCDTCRARAAEWRAEQRQTLSADAPDSDPFWDGVFATRRRRSARRAAR